MAAVAKAPPDGYTVALVPVGNAAVNPSLFPDLPYDLKQFAPITQIANVENVLVVSAKSAGQDRGGADRARAVQGRSPMRRPAPAASRISPPNCSRAPPASA